MFDFTHLKTQLWESVPGLCSWRAKGSMTQQILRISAIANELMSPIDSLSDMFLGLSIFTLHISVPIQIHPVSSLIHSISFFQASLWLTLPFSFKSPQEINN